MTVSVREALATGTQWLSDAGVAGAARDARILLATAWDTDPTRLAAIDDEQVPPDVFRKYDNFLSQREKFQPVSQIIGGREFWSRWFKVTRDVLDPRPETETLIEAALAGQPAARVLDMGTGSGILAVTLAAEWPDARVIATDISPEALSVAEENARAHEVSTRVLFTVSDWFASVDGKFDLIVSNPPYIGLQEMADLSPDVRNWEPFIALTPGGDGMDPYRVIASELGRFLDKGGLALFEIGYKQGEAVAVMFRAAGFNDVSVLKDLNGHDRIIRVQNG